MEVTGKLVGASLNFDTNHYQIVLDINENEVVKSEYDKLKALEKLSVKISRYVEKRSLDANAYFHVLVGKIADTLQPPISKARCKNMLICRYGQPEIAENGSPVVIKANIPTDEMLEIEYLHCLPCKVEVEKGQEIVFYKVYRGSHTYNSMEMSILIDGTVQEAKQLGIETITPTELASLKERWNI